MNGWVALILFVVIVFAIPIALGVLATGWTKKHNGPVACSACGYELTGIEGAAARCPECGAALAGEGTLRAGVARFRAHPWWVRYPSVSALLAAPFGVANLVYQLYLKPSLPVIPWVLALAYVASVWFVCRVPAQALHSMRRVSEKTKDDRKPETQDKRVTMTPPS